MVAGFVRGSAQLAVWGSALAILYLGALVGHMRGWRVSPEHFVERFGLIIIIAIGESIVAIGVGAARIRLSSGVIVAALLGITVAACLWWSYFDWLIYTEEAVLAEATGARRASLARDASHLVSACGWPSWSSFSAAFFYCGDRNGGPSICQRSVPGSSPAPRS